VKYNVSDIEAVSHAYFGETVGGTSSAGDGSDGVTKERASLEFLQNAYQSCTSCSICIDEFEQGETLILLPECGHFFHPQCITPWLKDKKGSCPLCQTMVLPQKMAQPNDNISDRNDSTFGNAVDGSTARVSSARGDGMNSSIQSVRGSISARGTSYAYIPSPAYATHSIEEESESNEVNDGNNASNEEAVSLSNGGNGDGNETFDEEAVPLSSKGDDDKNDNFNEEAVPLRSEGNGDNNETVDEEAMPLSNGGKSDKNDNSNEDAVPVSNGGNGDYNDSVDKEAVP